MQINITDLMLLFLLAVVVSFIIIMIINYSISDMSINMPEHPIPIIYIKNPNGEPIKAEIEKITYEEPKIKRKSETLNSKANSNNQVIEHLQVVGNQDMSKVVGSNEDGNNVLPLSVDFGKEREKVFISQGMARTGADSPNKGDSITYPDHDDIVRYNGPGCYQNAASRKIRRVEATNQRLPICKGKVNSGRVNSLDLKIIGPSGQISEHTANFYVPHMYMGGDHNLRGCNFGVIDYDGPADVDQVGSIPTNDYRGQPVPMGTRMNFFGDHINV